VTGIGYLTISDGTTATFTAQVNWDSILTVGGSGALNAGDTVNLSNFSYAGSNPVLQGLAADGTGTAEVSFQYVPIQSLTALTEGAGLESTSYSGSFEAIPEPSTYAAIAGAWALLGALVCKCSALRRSSQFFLRLLAGN